MKDSRATTTAEEMATLETFGAPIVGFAVCLVPSLPLTHVVEGSVESEPAWMWIWADHVAPCTSTGSKLTPAPSTPRSHSDTHTCPGRSTVYFVTSRTS